MKEAVPGALYSKHLFGTNLSVSVVKLVMPGGPGLVAKSHSHGEEASLQVRGSCSVFLGLGEGQVDPEFPMQEGEAMLIPAQAMHYGSNTLDGQGVCMRLNVVTPPRKEFGPEDGVTYYPLKHAPKAS
ncbi:MAG TPA: cupin domain-containing protein [Steroidobacteraceae bacterium]